MNLDGVRAAVAEIGELLRLDGADLEFVAADDRRDRVDVRLVLDDVECVECVLAPDQLREAIERAVQRRAPGEYEIRIDDPRG